MVQNASARVLIQAKKYDIISMTAVRKNLHCLPIKAKIDFKIPVLAWKAYNEIGPNYLSDLLDKKHTIHNIRSAHFKKQHHLSGMIYLPISVILNHWHLLKTNLKLIYSLNTIKRNYTNITVPVGIL